MKTNILLVLVTFASLSIIVYTFAFENGRQAGLADVAAARVATGATGGASGGFPSGAAGGGAGASGTPGAFGRGAAGGGAAGGNPGGAGGAGTFFGGLQGTVDKVDGSTLTVTVTRGQQTQQLRVTVGVSTTVQTMASGAIGDVKPGAHVLIGAENLGGAAGGGQGFPTEISARSITILPANAP
jgi:hypothetical protein